MKSLTSFSDGEFFTIKPWGKTPTDSTMYDDTWSVYVRTINGEPIGQFSHVVPFQPDLGDSDWSANNIATTLTHDQLQAIASIQVADDFTVDQKMEWLTWGGRDSWGAPMRIPGGGNWTTATTVKSIAAAWANQVVELTGEHRTFLINYNGKTQEVPMSRIKTFSDWKNISRSHPQVVECTAVTKTDYPILPKGHIWLPLVFITDNVWIFDRWLVK